MALRVLLSVVLFFMSLSLAFADREPTICLLSMVDLSETGDNGVYSQALEEALQTQLETARFELVPKRLWEILMQQSGLGEAALLNKYHALDLAQKTAADLVINGYFRIEEGRILLGLNCYDVYSENLLTTYTQTGLANLQIYTLMDEVATQISDLIKNNFRVRETAPETETTGDAETPQEKPQKIIYREKAIEMGKRINVTLFSPDEGADVLLAGKKELGRIKEGKLSFSVKGDTTLYLLVQRDGYHDAWQEYKLGTEDKTIALNPLYAKTEMALDFEYTLYQTLGVGVGFRYYLVPDLIFLRADNYFYMQGTPMVEGIHPLIHNDIRFQAGIYFLPQTSFFRIGLASGLGVILSSFTNPEIHDLFFTDFYLDYLEFWMELNFNNFIIYSRHELKYSLGIGNNLMGDRIIMGPWGWPQTLGVIWKW